MEVKNSVSSSTHTLSQSSQRVEDSKIVTIINKIKKSKSNTRIKSNKEIKNLIVSNKFINICYIDNSEFGNGRTPLIYAVQKNNFELSKFLVCYHTVNTNLIIHFILNIKYGESISDSELNNISKNCIIESDINHQDNSGNTALIYACKLNSKRIVELLLKHGANTNIVNNKNKSPLMYSCKNGNKNCVDMLLNYHAKLDIESYDDNKTAFKYACGSGKLPVIKTLIQHKAINNKSHYSDAFNYVPQNEMFDDVYNILQSYTEICLDDYEYSLSAEEEKEGKNHLMMVYYKNSMELISQCIQGNLENINTILNNYESNNDKEKTYYLDVNFKDKHGYTALMWASYLGHTEIVHKLIHQGKANINLKSDIEESAILLACEKGYVETVKILLEHGANVNDTNYHEDTLLMIGCLKGNVELTNLLLENKADVNAQNKSNDSALIYAVERNQEECVQLLLKYNADLTLKNDYNDSIFVIAYRKNNARIMELLLENYEMRLVNNFKTNSNIKNSEEIIINEENDTDYCIENNDFLELDDRNLIIDGKTLLMLSCVHENYEIMEILLKHHTDSSFKNFDGNTALHFACQMRNTIGAEILLKYNPELVHISNKKGKTPLMIACKQGDDNMVSLLLKYNSDINHRDHCNKTPLIMACKYGYLNIVNKLLDHHKHKHNESCDEYISSSSKSRIYGKVDNSFTTLNSTKSLLNSKKIRQSKMNKLKHKISNITHSHSYRPIKNNLIKKSSRILNNNYNTINNINGNNNTKNFMDNSYFYLLNKFKKDKKNIKVRTSKILKEGLLGNILLHSNASSPIYSNLKNKNELNKSIISNDTTLFFNILTPSHRSTITNNNNKDSHKNKNNETKDYENIDSNNGIIDIHTQDSKYGYTAFLWTCQNPNNYTIEIMKKLIEHGANINDINSLNQNALILTILNQTNSQNQLDINITLDIINFLIKNGIDINVYDLDKYTALMLACKNRSKVIVQRLLNAHADKTLLNEEGKTAMDIALEYHFFEIVQLF